MGDLISEKSTLWTQIRTQNLMQMMQVRRMMHVELIENIEIMGWRGVALTPVTRVRIPLGSPSKTTGWACNAQPFCFRKYIGSRPLHLTKKKLAPLPVGIVLFRLWGDRAVACPAMIERIQGAPVRGARA